MQKGHEEDANDVDYLMVEVNWVEISDITYTLE